MIEVAEVFRRFAADYLDAHGAAMPPSHRRAIQDILDCRTAALGGQVWRCDKCDAEVFSFHSCVMGEISNGESGPEPEQASRKKRLRARAKTQRTDSKKSKRIV
jgi:hypothetical protein